MGKTIGAGGSQNSNIDSGIYNQRTEDRFSDWLFDLYSFFDFGHGRRQHSIVHGYADVAPHTGVASFQVDAICHGGWMVPDYRFAHEKFRVRRSA